MVLIGKSDKLPKACIIQSEEKQKKRKQRMQPWPRTEQCLDESGKNSSNCLTELPITVLLHRRDHTFEGISAQLKDVNTGTFIKHSSEKIMSGSQK